ncbi:hypothetical protein OG599_19820 [Streptomyces sp. NBC_01335]|uniref:nitrilase-related carbon-nitrogen hydrolase n=1 Tax=Streptomyces sp. NBC_01335 TaxID=2903828 RepID=UPI002E14BC93|nr:hypothetical protein OG599_19820 [Streptomyces sp. NBC_01335]
MARRPPKDRLPLADACRETGTVAVVGAAFHEAGELYVSAPVIGADGEMVTRYDKQHLFTTEREVYRPGVWAPDGRLLTEAGPDRREVVTAHLDPAALTAAREAEAMPGDLGRVVAGGRSQAVSG